MGGFHYLMAIHALTGHSMLVPAVTANVGAYQHLDLLWFLLFLL